jgi:hypothetical protein
MEITLPDGRRISYPIKFSDATQAVTFFNVRAAEVRRLLPRDVKVFDSGYGLAEMYIAWIQARAPDLGPLDEVQIGFLVEDPYYRSPCTFLYANPISSEYARGAGVNLWNLHKMLARIDIQRSGGRARCEVSIEGREVVSIEGPETRGASQDFNSFMCVGDKSPTTVFRYLQRAGSWSTSDVADDVSVTTGEHPLGKMVGSLRYESKVTRYSFRDQCRFLIGPPLDRLFRAG